MDLILGEEGEQFKFLSIKGSLRVPVQDAE